MKNKRYLILLTAIMALVLVGCTKDEKKDAAQVTVEQAPVIEIAEDVQEPGASENTMMGNPWTESDKQGVLEATGFEMNAPADATDVAYSYMAETKMAQMSYVINGHDWCYRIQPADALTDISGMYYEWTLEDPGKVAGCDAVYLAYTDIDEDAEFIDGAFGVQVVYWYDAAAGVAYSLSASGTDLNGIDIQVFAEDIYSPLQGNVG